MIENVTRYVKICLTCKRIKIYKDDKHELLKLLSLSKRYFQNIFVDFIVELLVCILNDRKYQHIMMIIDKLSKKKRFIVMNFLKIETIIQIFID